MYLLIIIIIIMSKNYVTIVIKSLFQSCIFHSPNPQAFP